MGNVCCNDASKNGNDNVANGAGAKTQKQNQAVNQQIDDYAKEAQQSNRGVIIDGEAPNEQVLNPQGGKPVEGEAPDYSNNNTKATE